MIKPPTELLRTVPFMFSMVFVAACNNSFHDLGAPPQLTHVGYEVPVRDILVAPEPEVIAGPDRLSMSDNSIWSQKEGVYFRDNRAYKVGDILTVNIEMNDSARLDNSSERETQVDGILGASTDITLPIFGELEDISADGSLSTGLGLERSGTVDRTEQIQLQIAAAVIEATDNGNLYIRGSQEVRVNHELRILTVEGIVRARDILSDNTIPYDKIAEARITYGGHNSRRLPDRRKWWQKIF